MAFIKIDRPITSYTKIARLIGGKAARFGFAKFGQARFGITDEYVKVARPVGTGGGAPLADFAQADFAVLGGTEPWAKIPRPSQ